MYYIEINNLIQWTYCVQTCFYIVLIFKKYQHVITAVLIYVITSVITQLTHPLHLNLPLNLPTHLSQTLPISHLNSTKSDLQYNMSTISTL